MLKELIFKLLEPLLKHLCENYKEYINFKLEKKRVLEEINAGIRKIYEIFKSFEIIKVEDEDDIVQVKEQLLKLEKEIENLSNYYYQNKLSMKEELDKEIRNILEQFKKLYIRFQEFVKLARYFPRPIIVGPYDDYEKEKEKKVRKLEDAKQKWYIAVEETKKILQSVDVEKIEEKIREIYDRV